MNQSYLSEEMSKSIGGHIMVSAHLIEELFPEPKRATVEDIEHIMLRSSGLATAIHQGDVAHVYQPKREERLRDFCKINHAEMTIDLDGVYHFRHNTSSL